MNYVKKMCILRQIKQGFSGDGKALSGLIKAEQYGKNLAVEVSIINFAPLASGEYFCLLSDGKGKTEMLALRGKSIFNILTDMDISGGFCGIICYVKGEVVPIAYGIHGNGAYDWRAILNKAMPPVFPKKEAPLPPRDDFDGEGSVKRAQKQSTLPQTADAYSLYAEETEPTTYDMQGKIPVAATLAQETPSYQEEKPSYDDEKIAGKNYFEEEENERVQPTEINENAGAESGTKNEGTKAGKGAEEDDDAAGVLHPFKREGEDYYLSIKRELDELFKQYPADETLTGAFQRSEWVRLRGEENAPEFLVGALYDEGEVKYLCYALAAEDKDNPPQEIKEVCSFVPVSPYVGATGFFVIFQSAATGECVKPSRA